MRVGISTRGFGWAGGMELLRNFANALLAAQDVHPMELHLLLPMENHIGSARDAWTVGMKSIQESFRSRRLVLPHRQPRWHASFEDYFMSLRGPAVHIHTYENSTGGLARCIKGAGIDVLFPINQSLGSDFPSPWVGYISDFQHRYITYLFRPSECFGREVAFCSLLRDANAVVVNARTVLADVVRFYPWAQTSRIFALPFAPCALPDWFDELAAAELATYALPARYFMISNQFWTHKDHPTAFRALSALRDTSAFSDVGLVCTGAIDDYRNKDYGTEIALQLESLGLSGCVRLLGHIPKRHQIEIMKSAVAVVQPTLFEGGPGGGSAYDAVALGVPMILSDIEVNREVDAANLQFFPAGDDSKLSECMATVLRTQNPRFTPEELLVLSRDRRLALAESLVTALAAAAGK